MVNVTPDRINNVRLCAHCGERIITIVTCPVCHADVSDVAYHSGSEYALRNHADYALRQIAQGQIHQYTTDKHWELL